MDLVGRFGVGRRVGHDRGPDALERAAVALEDGKDTALVAAQSLTLAGGQVDQGQIADGASWASG
jgi:hypothetical protein